LQLEPFFCWHADTLAYIPIFFFAYATYSALEKHVLLKMHWVVVFWLHIKNALGCLYFNGTALAALTLMIIKLEVSGQCH
jgi:hypothetical protein